MGGAEQGLSLKRPQARPEPGGRRPPQGSMRRTWQGQTGPNRVEVAQDGSGCRTDNLQREQYAKYVTIFSSIVDCFRPPHCFAANAPYTVRAC